MSVIRDPNMERITTKELADKFIEETIINLKNKIGDKKVLLTLSRGVDSTVVPSLLIKAIGQNLTCIHVNHGLLRKDESQRVLKVCIEQSKPNLIPIDAVDRFLSALSGINESETKRKIIGKLFIDVFSEESKKLNGISFLAQGTIYPDIIESKGIKAHHNVGGLPP